MYSPELYYETAKIYMKERIDDAHKRYLIRELKGRDEPSRDQFQKSVIRLGEILEAVGRNLQGLQTTDCSDISRLGPRGTSYG
jgi:hypothetical protein